MSSKHLNDGANRIRDNQRRSRARQKEYLKSLESQVRNCNRLGVQASLEIQAAARNVLEENKYLRSLLESRGWSAPVIDDPNISQDQGGPRKSDATLLQEQLERHTACNEEKGGHEHCRTDPLQILQRSTSLTYETLRGDKETSSTMELIRSTPSGTIPNLCEEVGLRDTSSCAFAVSVITNMRPDIATKDVKSTLGCSGSLTECRIDDSRLFTAVDRYAE